VKSRCHTARSAAVVSGAATVSPLLARLRRAFRVCPAPATARHVPVSGAARPIPVPASFSIHYRAPADVVPWIGRRR